jgi:imidazolonepropionase-like amidohydrolase
LTHRLFVRAGTLIDGVTDTPHRDVLIVGDGERITEVKPYRADDVPAGARFIDAGHATVLPGLIDAHVHTLGSGVPGEDRFFTSAAEETIGSFALACYKNAVASMNAGWTTLRDVACRHFVDVDVRNAINAGDLVGPRLWVSGLGVTSSSGHMDFDKFLAPHVQSTSPRAVADDPTEARKAVRLNLARNVDLIKFNATLTEHVRRYRGYCAPEMTKETMQALIEEAHWHGRRVTAHCYGGEGATWAIESGLDCIEHGFYLDDDQLRMMADRGVALCPTLSVPGRFRQHGRAALNYRANVELMDAWRKKAVAHAWNTTRRALELGVTVICGDDAAMPYIQHGTNAYELEMLVEAGMTPMQALKSATSTAATVIDFPDVGAVEAGRFMDLVIVDGDPLADIRILQDLTKVPVVIKGGAIVADRRSITA